MSKPNGAVAKQSISMGVNGALHISKSKKELLKQLLELEDEDVGDIGENMVLKTEEPIENTETINDEEKVASVEKPKKKLTEKQLEALKKGQQKRNENREKNRLEKEKKEEEERKILEEKLVKKAIAVKKKQIKKQAVLDEISDDETPIEKVLPLRKVEPKQEEKKVPLFKFF
jgi:hypothetical protein